MVDTTIGWRFPNKNNRSYYPYSMGETAENVAQRWKYRVRLKMSLRWNPNRRFLALSAEKWNDEIIAVELVQDQLVSWVTKDEHPRDTSLEKLARLKPALRRMEQLQQVIQPASMTVRQPLLASEEAVKL
jgi:acetyl-CoA C-acetyltransferase